MLQTAVALHQQGRLADAERLYRSILRARPKHFEARHLFGILRSQQGRAAEALELITAALQAKPDSADALYNRGNILVQLDRFEEALASYDAALALEPDNEETHHNRGNVLFKLARPQEALTALERALALKPNYVEALNSRGIVLERLGRHDEALADYDRAFALRPDSADALYNRGNLLKELKRFEESVASYRQARAISTNDPDAFGIVEAALAICDWTQVETLAGTVRAELLAGRSSVTPFALVGYCDDPALHLQCARNMIADQIKVRPAPLWTGTRYQHERIRLAYLSADFREHATAYLIAELIELHDRARFEVMGVSFGAPSDSEIGRRLAQAFDAFHDVRAQSDREIAMMLRDHEIDIAVDLKGHTQDSRPGILAHRPAPIQVGYLGFPGTIGADFLDYVIADSTVLPFDQQPFYTEKIVHLPHCYQINDRKRSIAAATPSRQQAGLPETGFVFCCFNNNYKIARPIFEIWMRLLLAVPGSVLWLLRDNPGAEHNLRREAVARGVDPDRLIFADRCGLDAHLARHRLADLFLDTLPYNAHTTASDALWAGLPVLTCQGNAFAGRVAVSLLNAVGLPELVTHSLADYEALALRLATDDAMLRNLRETLARNRLSGPLFDTDRFRRGIEAAYLRMWDMWQRGESPQNFRVES
jgi:predicted O-linked N-acetylglucosamine transferase (SPINDLY family)